MDDLSKYYDITQKDDTMNVSQTLNGCLKELRACNEQILNHGTAIHRVLSQFEAFDSAQDLSEKIQAIYERATRLTVTSNAMTDACSKCLELIETHNRNWQQILQHVRDQQMQFEKVVEQWERQHSKQAVKEHQMPRPSSLLSTEDDENAEFYYDAQDEETLLNVEFPAVLSDSVAVGSLAMMDTTAQCRLGAGSNGRRSTCKRQPTVSDIALARKIGRPGHRRSKVPDKPNCPLNLWNIMKKCIGKELTKIPMPVNFSEPLSMLQRLTEDYEYAYLLDHAATLTDTCEQLAYVTAFTVSSYSTTAYRTGKPFNPLLGETYECDRTADLGWRCISEQVSHHPPAVAQYCEGKHWKCWQEFTMSTKFRGKYLQINPLGIAHLEFLDSGNHYTWKKVATVVHNIIIGKLWIDQFGDMDIVNYKDGSKCHLRYTPYSYFSKGKQRKVKGCVMNKDGKACWLISGTWDKEIQIAPVISQKGSKDKPIYETGPYFVIWTQTDPPEDCAKYYNFSVFACQLNQMEEGIAPTDSRLRPDQRLMEEGDWDEANEVKLKLEEKQRAARRQHESSLTLPYEPVWFKKEVDIITGTTAHIYKGGYWECKDRQDWSECPSIFDI